MIKDSIPSDLRNQFDAKTYFEVEKILNLDKFFKKVLFFDIKNKFRSRTLLILLHIALIFPLSVNISSVAKSLNIPKSTVTDEFRILINLNYVNIDLSLENLSDSRYKFYSLTSKGRNVLESYKRVFNNIPLMD